MLLLTLLTLIAFQQDPLTESSFVISRESLRLEPPSQSIILDPDGRPIAFELTYGEPFESDMRFEASLVGPGIAQPIAVDQPAADGVITLARNLFTEEGTYNLVGVSLTRGGQVLEVASPSSAEIRVAGQFLISEVAVRQLSRDDLEDRGYLFSEKDYYTLEFNLNLVVGAKKIPIDVPVAYPKTTADFYQPITLEDPFQPYMRVIGFKMPRFPRIDLPNAPAPPGPERSEVGDNYMPGLLVIPGNANYLKAHFEVIALVINVAPDGFEVSATNLNARLVLPEAGRFGLPLSVTQPLDQAMLDYGPDEVRATFDDKGQILAGDRAKAEYVVIGNQPGIYDIEIEIDGDLQIAGQTEPVRIRAESQVLVRSPEFSVHFDHPDAVAEDEPFEVGITFTNRGEVPIEDLSLVLDEGRLVGARLDGSTPLQTIDAIPVGGEVRFAYTLRSLISGKVFSSYFKLPDNVAGSLALNVGVGQTGQRISPYVFSYPPIVDQAFPPDLVAALKRYTKTALDFAQSDEVDLPSGLVEVPAPAVKTLATTFVQIARESGYGIPDHELMTRLLAAYQRSVRDFDPLDRVRRRFINNSDSDLEAAFGRALAEAFGGFPNLDMLSTMARENESTPGLIAFVVDTTDDVQILLQGQDVAAPDGRIYPFSGVFPLDGTRRLVWLSNVTTIPEIRLVNRDNASATIDFHTIFPDTGNHLHAAEKLGATIDEAVRVIYDPERRQARLEPVRGASMVLSGTRVPTKPFELVNLVHADQKLYPGSDELGRNFIFTFSKELDLSSLSPLEEHISIGDRPALDGVLQRDGRNLIVSARRPLGPYRPIEIEMLGARSRDGQVLGDLKTTIEGNPWFVGVTIGGRIDDRSGSDLSKAEVLLWIKPANPDLKERIYDRTFLDENNRYDFPFVPLSAEKVTIAVLLEDGRYERRVISPRGAGQDMVVDFAFFQTGTVQGRVTDQDGNPVEAATVYARNQANALSAGETQTDANGYYSIPGLEVGQIVVKTANRGILGINSGYLTRENSPLTLDLVLNAPTADISGTITRELDDGSIVPVADAFVAWIQQGSIVSSIKIDGRLYQYTELTTTAQDGTYRMQDVPAGNGFIWILAPGLGFEERIITVTAGEFAVIDHLFRADVNSLPLYTDVAGEVRDELGFAVEGATVYAADLQTTTGPDGRFELVGLPRDNLVHFSARHPIAGYGTFTFQLTEPRHDQVIIVLETAPEPATVSGSLRDANGDPLRFINIYKPPYFGEEAEPIAQSDFNGNWRAVIDTLGIADFTTLDYPRIGFTQVNVVEGGVDNVVIQQKHAYDLLIHLVDDLGRPVGGKVTLRSMLPITGNLATYGREELRNSHIDFFTDPMGDVLLEGVNAGPIEIFATHTSLGAAVPYSDFLENQPSSAPHEITIVFPTALEPANLFGTIYDTDGSSPAPAGTLVAVRAIGSGNTVDAVTEVDALGNYRFENLISSQGGARVEVIVADPATGRFDSAQLELDQHLDVRYDAVLKPKANVNVRVVNADGTPADFAAVQVTYRDVFFTAPSSPDGLDEPSIGNVLDEGQITPSQPVFQAADVPAGAFTVRVNSGNGLVGMRNYSVPLTGDAVDLTIRLEATSQIDGIFVDRGGAPLGTSEVALLDGGGILSTRLTSGEPDTLGTFTFPDLPMRNYALRGTDPDTRLSGSTTVATSPYQPNPFVVLALAPIANVAGLVTLNGAPVPGARITLDGPAGRLITGTGSDGRYLLSILPLGAYQVSALVLASGDQAQTNFRLDQADTTQSVDLELGATFKDVEVMVLGADGAPVGDLLLTAYTLGVVGSVGSSAFTDDNGRALLQNLKPGRYEIFAEHPTEFAPLFDTLVFTAEEPEPLQRTFQFPGWGAVEGTLTDRLGVIPDQGATVVFQFHQQEVGVSADRNGYFRLERLPIDTNIQVTAFHPVTGEPARATVRLATHQEEVRLELVFTPATFVRGQVTFQDGTPVPFAAVRSTAPAGFVIADETGTFLLDPVLVGDVTITASDPASGRTGALTVTVTDDGAFPIPVTGVEVSLGGLGAIEGVVTYDDGAPMLTGTVSLYKGENQRVASIQVDGAGRFRFREIPLGSYTAEVFDPKYSKDSARFPVDLLVDGETAVVNPFFEPDFNITGRVFAANGVDVSPFASVQLWREEPNGRYSLVYATEADDLGNYLIDHVYPETYRLEANDNQLSARHVTAITVVDSDIHQDFTLSDGARILGIATDASGRPFVGGSVTLTQNGRVERVFTEPDGSYEFGFTPVGPYQIDYAFNGGWLTGSLTGTLTAGTNPINITTEDTATVQGRAILIKDPPSRPAASLIVDDIARSLSIAADGFFIIDGVPHGKIADIALRYGAVKRTLPIGLIGTDLDIGDLFLDAIPPTATFDQAGTTITNLPFTLSFATVEPDPHSEIDPAGTFVFLNGADITAAFTIDASGGTATFDRFPAGILVGENTLSIRTRNLQGAVGDTAFTFTMAEMGATLVVQLRQGNNSAQGNVTLNNGTARSTNAEGQVYFNNVLPGEHTLKAIGNGVGSRQRITVGTALNQTETLSLAAYGEYRGAVLQTDGTPVAGAVIQIGDEIELTDETGSYVFNLLPLGDHDLFVNWNGYLGYTMPPSLVTNQQVESGIDVQLLGAVTLTGTVFDDDGLTPTAGVAVTLSYPGFGAVTTQTGTSEVDGSFQFTNVMARDIRLSARQPVTNRTAEIARTLEGHQLTIRQDLVLSPAGDLDGILADSASLPIAGALITAAIQGGELTATATSAADGSFSFTDLPYGNFRLTAEHPTVPEYLDRLVVVDANTISLGTLRMTVDQPAVILSSLIPDPYYLGSGDLAALELSDDRGLTRVEIAFTGAHNGTAARNLSGTTFNGTLALGIPDNATAGAANFELRVHDSAGQITRLTGTIQLVAESASLTVTLTNPLEGAVFNEFESIPIRATAEDSNSGINRIEFYLDGALVGIDNYPTYGANGVTPKVTADTIFTVEARAFNNAGLSRSAFADILVQAVQTTGSPALTLHAPIDQLPLPIFLETGLPIRVAARVLDDDELESFAIRFAGQEVLAGPLTGKDVLIDESIVVPAALRGLDTLHIEVETRDLGGNATVVDALVNRLDISAPFTVKGVDDPLNLPRNDAALDGQTLLLIGGTHIIDGSHDFEHLLLLDGAVLTQSATNADLGHIAHTDLAMTGHLVVEYGSAINVDGKGYAVMPDLLGFADARPSHGGLGHNTTDTRLVYGSPVRPVQPGSFFGGGAVKLQTRDLWVVGEISADSRMISGEQGSGGSIWLIVENSHGLGRVTANGFNGIYSASDSRGGGGGRIAIYGDFTGTAQAFGGRNAGAGTVYRRMVDAAAPRGFTDSLTLANASEATSGNATPSRELANLVVGTDVTVSTQVIDNVQRQVFTLTDPTALVLDSNLGMAIFKHGAPETFVTVAVQTPTDLRTAENQALTLQNGDLIHVALLVDQIHVRNGADYHPPAMQTPAPVSIHDAALTSGAREIDLADISFSGAVKLNGSFYTAALALDPSFNLTVTGSLRGDNLVLENGTLTLNGDLNATSLTLAADAVLTTPADLPGAGIRVNVPNLTVAGVIQALDNPVTVEPNHRFRRSHGGFGDLVNPDSSDTMGSLYEPRTNGGGFDGGGRIHLIFDTLMLDGGVVADGIGQGAGGSILLEGSTLSGSGRASANGGPIHAEGGGGRIAVLVENLASFSGTAQAFGGGNGAGAGTVFYRNSTWPNGRLVLDNNGLTTPDGSTLLPSLGTRTATVASAAGTTLDGTDFPPFSSLTGLYAVIGDSEIPIEANSETQLVTGATFPALAVGETYSGLHIFDVVEIRGGASLRSEDAIRILGELVVVDGGIDSPDLQLPITDVLENGSLELFENPGYTNLELNNFQLTVHFPLDLGQLTLNEGSVLITDQGIEATTVTLNEGEIVLDTNLELTAQTLIVGTQGVISTPDGKTGAGIHINAANLRVDGEIRAHGNTAALPIVNQLVHGGYSRGANPDTKQTYGSLYLANTHGMRTYSTTGAGGTIALNFDTMTLNGTVQANGTLAYGTGGSVRLTGTSLLGNGTLAANGYDATYQGGGGRVAVYVEDLSGYSGNVSAYGGMGSETNPDINGAAGTVFYQNSTWPDGRLVIDNRGAPSIYRGTTLPGLGTRTVDLATGGAIIAGSNFPILDGLSGLYAVFDGGITARIDRNTTTELFPEDAFPTLANGDTYHGLHILDVLEVRGGASLYGPDGIQAAAYVFDDGEIHVPSLVIPESTAFANGGIELHEPIDLTALELDNFHLTVHFPVQLDHIQLTNGASFTSTADVTVSGNVDLGGNTMSVVGDLDIGGTLTLAGGALRVDGTLNTPAPIAVHDGEILTLDGTITAPAVTVANGGLVRTPAGVVGAKLHLDAATIVMAGVLQAHDNAGNYGAGLLRAHGGYAQNSNLDTYDTYGTLYRPMTNGMRSKASGPDGTGAGGLIHLAFETLDLTGRIDCNGTAGAGSGGSVLLEGMLLQGHGTITADGYNASGRGGGGRVGLLVDDLAAFTGTVSAYGGQGNTTSETANGGAGTVFYRTNTWPNGRLVVDNRFAPTPQGFTQLPGLGQRTAPAATGGAAIAGSDFPSLNGLSGLHVEFTDQSTAPIAENTDTELLGTFPALAQGDSYRGIHILDVLEVRGAASLATVDAVRVLDHFVFDGGSISSPDLQLPATPTFRDGAIELYQPIELANLELDNFHMVLHFATALDGVTLRNGASLTITSDALVAGDVNLNGNSMRVTGHLEIQGSLFQNGGHLTVGDLTTSTPLLVTASDTITANGRLVAPSIEVAAGGMIRTPSDTVGAALHLDAPQILIDGTLQAHENAGGYGTQYRYSHGGFGRNVSTESFDTYGTLYRPQTSGMGNAAAGDNGGGGIISLSFDSLGLNGQIDTNGTASLGSGGSILLDGNQLVGTGSITADGFDDGARGAGGRVGVLVEDLSSFSGQVSAYGGLASATNPSKNGGAGTMFYRNSTWPNGRLVIDNRGAPTLPGQTELPGLGSRTVQTATGGAVIAGNSFPSFNDLAGLHVEFADQSIVPIQSHSETELFPIGAFPNLAVDDTYRGIHIFDVLEVRGGGTLATPDAIRVIDQFILNGGSIDSPDLQIAENRAFANGAIELFQAIDLVALELDNFDMTLHFPVNLESITLTNGATLTVYGDVTLSGDVNLLDGNLTVAGNVTLPGNLSINGNTMTVAGELIMNQPFLLTAGDQFLLDGHLIAPEIGVAAGSTLQTPTGVSRAELILDAPLITIDGSVQAHDNAGNYPNSRLRFSHGGHNENISPEHYDTYGSLYNADTHGQYNHSSGDDGSHAGGHVRLLFDTLVLQGTVDASGTGSWGSGGSVRLEGNLLQGTGSIAADGFNGHARGGGGRVALYVEDLSGYSGSVSAYGGMDNATNPNDNGGAGTVFYRNSTWPNGRLVLDNGGAPSARGATELPGLGTRTTPIATGGSAIATDDLPTLNSLAGLYVAFADQSLVRIASHSETELLSEGTFPALAAGESYRGVHLLDVLEVRGGADLTTVDEIHVLSDFVFDGGTINCANLVLPQDTYFANGAIDILQGLAPTALELDNFDLQLHDAVDLDYITLLNGAYLTNHADVNVTGDVALNGNTLTVAGDLVVAGNIDDGGGTLAVTGRFSTPNPVIVNDATWLLNGTLTAPYVQVNATGAIHTPPVDGAFIHIDTDTLIVDGHIVAHDNRGTFSTGRLRYAHGGYSAYSTATNYDTYGSLYQADTNGSPHGGGGAIRLDFIDMSLTGTVNANGTVHNYATGGSVQLKGASLNGTGTISANGFETYGGGGRIALRVEDLSQYSGMVTAYGSFTSTTDPSANGGAGTIFYQNSDWPNGRLVFDNGGTPTDPGSTRLPALGERTVVANTGGTVINGANFPVLNGLAGLYVETQNDTYQIASNTNDQLMPATSFPNLTAGDSYRGMHIFDEVEILGGANVITDDAVFIWDNLIEDGTGLLETPELLLFGGTVGKVPAKRRPHAALQGADTLHVDQWLELDGDRQYDKVYVGPEATLRVNGRLQATHIELDGGTLIVAAPADGYAASLRAGELRMRDALLQADHVQVYGLCHIDSGSLLTPGGAGLPHQGSGVLLGLAADQLQLAGRIENPAGKVQLKTGTFYANGGHVTGTLMVAGGVWKDFALSVDTLIAQAPLILIDSLLESSQITAPELVMEGRSAIHIKDQAGAAASKLLLTINGTTTEHSQPLYDPPQADKNRR